MHEPLPTPQRRYISQLDALRFFAAILTAFYHGSVVKSIFGAPNRPRFRELHFLGVNCVTFFFVLSGFVITWLLLREKAGTQTVNVKAFYLRRVFRIWPLYYLILLTGFFVVPFLPGIEMLPRHYETIANLSASDLAFWFTFFPNLSMVGVMVPQLLVSHTWSIGMEEQFYVIWPWLAKKFSRPALAMGLVLLVFLAARFCLYPIFPSPLFQNILLFFRFDCMAIGGLVAVYYHSGHWQQKPTLLQRPAALYALGIACTALTLLPLHLDLTYFVVLSALAYGAFILALSLQPYRMQWLNHPALRYLGAISYGIYMFNPMGCVLALHILKALGGGDLHLFNQYLNRADALYYPLCLGITVALSALSYRFLEAPFLRLKDRLAQTTA